MTVLTDHDVELRALLASLPSYAVAARLAEVSAVLRVELVRGRGRPTLATVRIAGGTVEVLPDAAHPADVVLRTTPETYAAIHRGERNAGLEFVRGTLDIEGDTAIALAIGAMIREAGTTDTPMDPRALDPVDVAVAVGEVSAGHLKKVMRSGFREVVLGEIFRRLPDYVNPRRAAKVNLTVGFRLLGHPSGEIERYVVTIAAGAATVTAGDSAAGAGERDATLTCEGHDFVRLALGHLNPVLGVLRGQLKVRGDQAKALQLTSVIDIPHAG